MDEGLVKIILAVVAVVGTVIVATLPLVFSKMKQIHILVNSQSEKQDAVIDKQKKANESLHEAYRAMSAANNDLKLIIARLSPQTKVSDVLLPNPEITVTEKPGPVPVEIVNPDPVPVVQTKPKPK